jgi:hypothetical protein
VVVPLAGGTIAVPHLSSRATSAPVPIRIAGGTVKVKDEVKIEFDIVPSNLKYLFLDSTAICTSELR